MHCHPLHSWKQVSEMFLEVQSSVEGNSQVFQLFLNLYSVISHTRYVDYVNVGFLVFGRS